MPRINFRITKAWVHKEQPDRIHYMVEALDGQRRRWAKEGTDLFEQLYDYLRRTGYAHTEYLTRYQMTRHRHNAS